MDRQSRKNFVIMTIFASLAVAALIGCSSSKNSSNSPTLTNPTEDQKTDETSQGGRACENPEPDMAAEENQTLQVIELEHRTSAIRTVEVDCNGNESEEKLQDTSLVSQVVIPRPTFSQPGKIGKVELEAERTCSTLSEAISVATIDPNEMVLTARISENGDLLLPVSQGKYRESKSANVREGLNLLKLKYYRCKVRERNSTLDCSSAELAGEQKVVLKYSVKRTTLPEVRKINVCHQ